MFRGDNFAYPQEH